VAENGGGGIPEAKSVAVRRGGWASPPQRAIAPLPLRCAINWWRRK